MILYIFGVNLGGSICLCVSLTTLHSEEITVCSDSGTGGRGSSAFGVCIFIYGLVFPDIFSYVPVSLNDNMEQWRHHSVLWQWSGGSICLWVSMTTWNSEDITLSSDSGMGGPSAFGICIFIYALVFPDIFSYVPVSPNDNMEQWRHHSVLWQWSGGVHLPLSLNDNMEQWRHHSVLWQWSGGSICLWVSMTTWNSEEITLCSDSLDRGVHLPLVSTCFLYALVFPYISLLFDCFKWALTHDIEKHRGHSVL